MSTTSPLETVREQYVRLCRSPLRDDATIGREFDELLRLSKVTHVALANPQTLMVATSMISIKHPNTKEFHDIGEFIIHLYRERPNKIWEAGFAFENITGMIAGRYHHPHITNRDLPGLGNLGILCIQRGQFHVYQHLRSGEFVRATSLLIDILHTYGSHPFTLLEAWPKRKVSW